MGSSTFISEFLRDNISDEDLDKILEQCDRDKEPIESAENTPASTDDLAQSDQQIPTFDQQAA